MELQIAWISSVCHEKYGAFMLLGSLFLNITRGSDIFIGFFWRLLAKVIDNR